ncbi:sugar kinase [Reinekea thalattae]|uniref:2-dehydro-3-deoxygluconokinase n=1 Tax=Reinekea thalattae TaxID=2593301 RepID=A0A5C8Z284_9GAMM|nr:sugar kinase [Reinekea thalattae]TXR51358.1 sugar kinase [Reinekea thalattae]
MTVTSKKKIALIGECMIQLQLDSNGQIQKSFAGDTLNTAVYLSRLEHIHQTEVHYITALGTDDFSDEMLQQWKDEGIHCDSVRRLEGELPGMYYINVDEHGERSFLYWRSEAAAKKLLAPTTEPALTSLADFDYIYLSGISLAILPEEGRDKLIELLKAARAQGSKVYFDNNFRPRLWQSKEDAQSWYKKVLSITDSAILTYDDEEDLWGDQSTDATKARCKECGISEIVIKRGSDPCLIESADFVGEVAAQKVAKEAVVDTTAAGDSFSAGYLAGALTLTAKPNQSAAIGHLVAGTVIQHLGGVIDKAPIAQLDSAIQQALKS